MVILVEVELNHFKTFMGSHEMKFNGNLVVITGPNGSGKSNIMDAIAFAMGAKITDLRVSRLNELLHSAVPKTTSMWVKVILRSVNGDEHCFKRSIIRSNCHYHINDKEVSFCNYEEELKKLNVNARLKNSLVFQDSIESIITMRPKEMTMIFEEMSGSVNFKVEYERLLEQLRHYEMEHQYLLTEKRNLTAEIRDAQRHREAGKIYVELLKQNETSRLCLLLFNLYHIRRMLENFVSDEQKLKETIAELGKKKQVKENELKRLLADYASITEESTKWEEACKPKELEVKEISNKLIKTKAKKEHLQKRVSTCEKSYESSKKADEARKKNIRDLEDALVKCQQEKKKYIRQYADTLGKDVQLSQAKIEEYEKLKNALCAACSSANHRLLVLDREYKMLKDIYDDKSMKLNEAEIVFKQKSSMRQDIADRVGKWEDSVRKAQNNLDTKRSLHKKLTAIYEHSIHEEERLKREIDKISDELGDYEEDMVSSLTKKNEIVRVLQERFVGVYKRLGDLCHPIHNRYNVAVTKVFGVNADAIVVNEAKTAMDCIKYLKDNRIGKCKFLPLDQLRECMLSEQLRAINDPPNVKLVYDVIKFEPPEISKAVFYATENTLVCETPEHALRVAYQMSSRQNCVSLDGCYYKKSGIISGGNRDLARKARRWEFQKIELLKENKEILSDELRNVLKTTPKQMDLYLLTVEMRNIELHLKYLEGDRIKAQKDLAEIENELEAFEKQKEALKANAEVAKFNMDKAFEAMNELKREIDAKEAQIFAEFCRSIGVDDIHDFEEGKNSYDNRMNEFEQHIDRIKNQLSYERNRDTENTVERWKKNLSKVKNELADVVQREIDQKSRLDEVSKELEAFQSEFRNLVNAMNDQNKNISQLRNEIGEMAKKHKSLSNTLTEIQGSMGKKRARVHSLLVEAKMSGFSILTPNDESSHSSQTSKVSLRNTETDSLSQTYELEANLGIDFSRLPEEFRVLDGDEIFSARERLEKDVSRQLEEIEAIKNPDMRGSQHVTTLQEKLAEINRKLAENRKMMRTTRVNFDIVKNERCIKFNQLYNNTSNRVDFIYKQLMRNSAAQAYIVAENPEEPYLAGIRFHCVVPGKRFQINHNLSGGEKTMASLALLFALQISDDKEPPFDFFDEIDAALDHANASKVVRYIKEAKENQTVVISHKKEFLKAADSMIGVASTGSGFSLESIVLTLDLSRYAGRVTRQ